MNRQDPRRGDLHVSHRLLHAVEIAAIALALIFTGLLALDQQFSWLGHRPGGQAFDLTSQPVFMALYAIGALLALRFRLLGGALATFTAAALLVFTSRQFRLPDGLVVFAGFLVPGLLWITVGLFELRDELFHRAEHERPRPLLRRRDVLGGIGVLALAGIGGVTAGRFLFDRVYGPTHPASTAKPITNSLTRWVWSGAVTARSAVVTTRLQDDDLEEATLIVSSDAVADLDLPAEVSVADEGFVRASLTDLEPDTEYHYMFRVAGEIDSNRVGRFRTMPEGPAGFSIAFGSCARTGSNGAVFDAIRSADPSLVIIDGDLHYADIAQNSNKAFREVLDYTLTRPAHAALWQNYPVAYVWDDHDFGGQDESSNSRPAAMESYRQYVPHYPLASRTSSVFQAFTVGRVRILITDTRSSRQAADDEDGALATMLGKEQKEWLKAELAGAGQAHELTIWVNPVPWISALSVEGDDWSAHSIERVELADHIADNGLASRLLMLSGDAHMTAIDDGTNSDYSTGRRAGFPVFHAGALDRPGRVKGGPYSNGTFPNGGQFGLVEIEDDGTTMRVKLSGRDWRNEEFLNFEFTPQ
ncbi:MAG: alkaline phosphatase D family protein [Acidimicrobiales bacterium]